MSFERYMDAAQHGRERRYWELEARLGDLAGQMNALFGEASQVAAEIFDTGQLDGTGVRSLAQFLEWKLGLAPGQARQLATIAKRRGDLPQTIGKLDEGLLSVDQVGAIATRLPADERADAEFAELAPNLTVTQIRKAVRATVPPDRTPKDPEADDDPTSGAETELRDVSFGHRDDGTWGAQIQATAAPGAHVEAGLRSHFDALMLEWKEVVNNLAEGQDEPPMPTWFDALERMVDRSLEREATDRPHCQRTKVLVHVRAGQDLAQLHLGPALSAAERALLGCDANIATVIEDRFGVPVSVGREHRTVPDKLRALVEHRDGGCAVPWCGATKYLVVHHIFYWEDGGVTETWNLICLCPLHHRAVHRGELRISGNADQPGGLVITDASRRRRLTGRSAARPPTEPPPATNRYEHPYSPYVSLRDWIPPHIATDERIPPDVATAA